MQFFEKLGQRIDEAWAGASHDEHALPEIAEQFLRAAQCHEHVDVDQVASWLMSAASLPPQGDLSSAFGEPTLVVFNNGRLLIQLLHWVVGTTSIHEHGFFGAFSVLEGSSVHARYQFTPTHTINPHFLVGTHALQQVELLRRGDIRRITGRGLIHSLFHLDFPSISIVVRTVGSGSEGPQLDHHRPSIAVYPFVRDPLMVRRLQYLKFLARTRPAEHQRWTRDLLEGAGLHETFLVLQQLAEIAPERPFWDEMLSLASRRHGEVTSTFGAVFAQQRRDRAIVSLRSSITDASHRFFLALLLVLPERSAIFEMIRQRFPDADPRQKAAEWVSELGESLMMGVEFDELNGEIVRLMILGMDDKMVLGALGETFSPEDIDSQRQELLKHFAQLRAHPILAPLLQER
ncbi:cupin domain-containing protein [Archangium lipolyticum]|uniref:hypothetical protein n=1 Tax=Archangium lipolyticum TaxID=2970465 RepID=UPI002149A742|nr:hypothetical protein [Archangium lipolyticum]